MKKATFQQTALLLLLTILLCLPLGSSGQPEPGSDAHCQEILNEINDQGGDLNDDEVESLCNFIAETTVDVLSDCPPPENLTGSLDPGTNTVLLDWDTVIQAEYYRVSYLNIGTGTSSSFIVDVTFATIPNLPPGEYYFWVQSKCIDTGGYSNGVGIFIGIIGDIAVIRNEPNLDCICPSPTIMTNMTLSSKASQHQTPWAQNLSCAVQNYDLTITAQSQIPSADPLVANIVITRSEQSIPNQIALKSCSTSSNHSVYVDDDILYGNSINFGLATNVYQLQFSDSDGIYLYPQQNGDYTYSIVVNHCCGSGGGKADRDDNLPGERSASNNDQTLTTGNLLTAPNPFAETTQLSYTIQKDSELSLVLYNALGQQVRQLKTGYQTAGTYQLTLDGQGLNPGLYYLHLKTNSQDELLKMIKL